MRVVFVQYGEDIQYATMMVASCKRRGYEVWQLADMAAPEVPGIDRIQREPMSGPRNLWRYKRLADLDGEYVSLDTDMLVASDISHGFGGDVALSWRSPNLVVVDGEPIPMPYNGGLVMVSNPAFIRECYARMQAQDPKQSDWWGDQIALRDVAQSGAFAVRELRDTRWNFSPNGLGEIYDGALIYHFKGLRKRMMKPYFEELFG